MVFWHAKGLLLSFVVHHKQISLDEKLFATDIVRVDVSVSSMLVLSL